MATGNHESSIWEPNRGGRQDFIKEMNKVPVDLVGNEHVDVAIHLGGTWEAEQLINVKGVISVKFILFWCWV